MKIESRRLPTSLDLGRVDSFYEDSRGTLWIGRSYGLIGRRECFVTAQSSGWVALALPV